MCRNIRVLYHIDPPTTDDEIRGAALQYVRKVSGLRHPPATDVETFDRAIEEVAATTRRLLASLRAPRSARAPRSGRASRSARRRGLEARGALEPQRYRAPTDFAL